MVSPNELMVSRCTWWSRLRPRRGFGVAFVAFAAVTLLSSTRADADQRLHVALQWDKLAEVILSGGASLLPEMGWSFSGASADPAISTGDDSPWVGTSPRVTVVARDWGGSGLVIGRLAPTDEIRLSRSVRMLLARVRATAGRFVPFAHIALGQWRVDTTWLPLLRPDVELAGQVGVGFEVALSRYATIAFETDYTILYRDQHEPQMVCEPRIWGSFLVARGRF